MFDIFKKRRTIIMDEEDVTKVLSVVNDHVDITYDQGIIVDECEWPDNSNKWFILTWTNNKQWELILNKIKDIKSVETE